MQSRGSLLFTDPVTVLSQKSDGAVYSLRSYFLQVNFNIILFTLDFPSDILPSVLGSNFYMLLKFLPCVLLIPPISALLIDESSFLLERTKCELTV